MKTIGMSIVAALVGFAAMCVAIAFNASDNVCVSLFFCGTLFAALLLGVFDGNTAKRAKHKSLSQGYREAA